jgi:chromosome segregation ATPase
MTVSDTLRAERESLRPLAYPHELDQLEQALDAAQARFNRVHAIPERDRSGADAKEWVHAEIALTRARGTLEHAKAQTYAPRNRIAEIDRLLSGADREDQARKTINELADAMTVLQFEGQTIDAAVGKLATMRDDAAKRLEQVAGAAQQSILASVGLPGAEAAKYSPSEASKARIELDQIDRAIEQAERHQAAHRGKIDAHQAQLNAAQAEILSAQADRLALEHAQALSIYLPALAALRRAELAAQGSTGNPVDVEALARTMLEVSDT